MDISVICSKEKYRYSTYHIVKAFFPEGEVKSYLAELESAPVPDNSSISVQSDDGLCITIDSKTASPADVIRELYDRLAAFTGKELPWGLLTGVRPVKLAMTEIRENAFGAGDAGRFAEHMRDSYRVSIPKSELLWDIAGREKRLAEKALGQSGGSRSFSLYIGIPVCPSICSYCSFSSGPLHIWANRMDDYVNALCSELMILSKQLSALHLTSIYIGGGTPTVLTADQLDRLLSCVDRYFLSAENINSVISAGIEYTLEAGRPDCITKDKLQIALNHGVTRISINPQTMQQRTLDAIGRAHTVQDVVDKFELARNMGFDNINMDLIAGLPGETVSDMEDTLRQIGRLKPDSLTVHTLAVKRRAAMDRIASDGAEVARMTDAACRAALDLKLAPYYLYRQKSMAGNLENIGYARPGKECIYNVMIMEELQHIIACGAGASSKIFLDNAVPNPQRGGSVMTNILHCDNPKDISLYIKNASDCAREKLRMFDEHFPSCY